MKVSPELMAQARELGFNDQLTVEGRKLNVQTEVTGTSPLKVRTVVMEGGMVHLAETRMLPEDARDIGELRAVVEAQHKRGISEILAAKGS